MPMARLGPCTGLQKVSRFEMRAAGGQLLFRVQPVDHGWATSRPLTAPPPSEITSGPAAWVTRFRCTQQRGPRDLLLSAGARRPWERSQTRMSATWRSLPCKIRSAPPQVLQKTHLFSGKLGDSHCMGHPTFPSLISVYSGESRVFSNAPYSGA